MGLNGYGSSGDKATRRDSNAPAVRMRLIPRETGRPITALCVARVDVSTLHPRVPIGGSRSL
jgi:hypothetical protein